MARVKITAESITDEQIRELDRERWREPLRSPARGRICDLCIIALSTSHYESRMWARAKCAELINTGGIK